MGGVVYKQYPFEIGRAPTLHTFLETYAVRTLVSHEREVELAAVVIPMRAMAVARPNVDRLVPVPRHHVAVLILDGVFPHRRIVIAR